MLLTFFFISFLVAGIMVLGSSSSVYSAFFLVLVFCNATIFLLIMGIEYVSLLFIIIYVGAIAVLFLFIVMMLNLKKEKWSRHWYDYFLLTLLSFLFVFYSIKYYWFETSFNSLFINNKNIFITFFSFPESILIRWVSYKDSLIELALFGQFMYTDYVILFLLTGIVLLIALIGAILIILNKNLGLRKQEISHQLSRSSLNSFFFLTD